jgi:hypothetical protein
MPNKKKIRIIIGFFTGETTSWVQDEGAMEAWSSDHWSDSIEYIKLEIEE